MVEELFSLFDGYLARQGYVARGGQILDATIVPVTRNHNKCEENAAIKADKAPKNWANKPAKRSQKDIERVWTKTRGRSYFGYKNHVNVDRRYKLVRRYHVTDASVHDSQAVDELLTRDNTSKGVRADSAYRSAEIEAELVARGLTTGLRADHIHCRTSIINEQPLPRRVTLTHYR